MSELARRWSVAGVGIPIVVVLLYAGGWLLAVPVAALAALGALEGYRLAEARGIEPMSALGAAGAAALVLLAGWRSTWGGFAPGAVTLIGGLAVVALLVAIFRRGPARSPLAAVAITVFGALYAGLALSFVPLLRGLPVRDGWMGDGSAAWAGVLVVALPLASTWVGDAAAYFAGSAWGRKKLAPTISPNKSWVGVWVGVLGAAAAAALWFVIAAPFLPGVPLAGPAAAAGIGALLGVGAILGDLSESLLKREAGLKDSGAVFPGHGGVLDRIDALIFTLPGAYAALALASGP